MAQSAASAYETVGANYQVHSLHAHFFRQGQCRKPIFYRVEVLSDGKTFSSRRVMAEQDGKLLASSNVGFALKKRSPSPTIDERSFAPGAIVEHADLPHVPMELPESYHDDFTWVRRDCKPAVEGCRLPIVSDLPSTSSSSVTPTPSSKLSRQYLRSFTPVSKELNNRANVLAIIALSDMYLGDTPIRIHGIPVPRMPPLGGKYDETDTRTPRVMSTINHSISFADADAARADEWVYVESESPWAKDGRVMATSRIFNANGRLVATCTQEVCSLLRILMNTLANEREEFHRPGTAADEIVRCM